MGDIFKEQLIKKLPSSRDIALKALIVIAAIALVVSTFVIIPTLAPLLSAAAIFLAYYLNGMLNVEYEYIFTNGDLDIDSIYAKSRRKRVFSGNVKDFEIMAHVDDKEHKRDFDSAAAVKDYSSGKTTDNTYAFIFTISGKRTKVIFEPNDTILKAFVSTMPKRKLFVKSNEKSNSGAPTPIPVREGE